MEQTFTWKDPHSIRTETVRYEIQGDNCHVIDSYQHVDNDRLKEDFIRHVMDTNPNFLTGKRSIQSYVIEWKAHNILYRWGMFKQSTQHADLNISESYIRRLGYCVLVRFFRESDKKNRYKKIMKKQKKELDKIHKDLSTSPWAGGYGIEYFVQFLRFMRDYYENGYNVHAYDNCECPEFECPDRPTRLQSLNMVIAAYDEWQACENKYYKWVPNDPTKYIDIKTEDNGDGTCTITDLGGHIQYLLEDPEENRKAFIKEYETLRKQFFDLLAEYYEDWSD